MTVRALAEPLLSCLDMPIKLPGGDVRVLHANKAVREFVDRCLAFEAAIANVDGLYAYLTVDQRVVAAGQTHRNAGWHFDGMQGRRYCEKLPVCHQYVLTSGPPTEFAARPFEARHLHEWHHDWFSELGRQVEPADVATFGDDILLMSAYCVHRSPVAQVAAPRTFLRLDFSHKKQDRLGNSSNPLLARPFPLRRLELPPALASVAISDAGWEGGRRPR